MLILSAIVFAIVLCLGAFLASRVLTNKNTPKAVAFIHGGLGALGILILIIATLIIQPAHIWVLLSSVIVFVLAALGGFFLIFKDLTNQNIPKLVVITHGSVALIGFALLVFFLVKYF